MEVFNMKGFNIDCSIDRGLGMDESLFMRLENTRATFDLNLQYRMNRWVKLNTGEFLYEFREYWSYI